MKNIQSKIENINKTKKLMIIILIINWLISGIKVTLGFLTSSSAIIADGVESFADGASNIIGFFALKISANPKDDNHPYGHFKYETFASALIGSFLLIVGFFILKDSLIKIYEYYFNGIIPVIKIDDKTIFIMVFVLIVNICLVKWQTKKGKELKSVLLLTDAKHTSVDIIITGAVILSLFITPFFPLFDPLVSFGISFMILKASKEIFTEIDWTLSDKIRIDNKLIENVVLKNKSVIEVNNIRSRGSELAIFIDLELVLDKNTKLSVAHDISDQIENMIFEEFPEVIDVVVHLEPNK